MRVWVIVRTMIRDVVKISVGIEIMVRARVRVGGRDRVRVVWG